MRQLPILVRATIYDPLLRGRDMQVASPHQVPQKFLDICVRYRSFSKSLIIRTMEYEADEQDFEVLGDCKRETDEETVQEDAEFKNGDAN